MMMRPDRSEHACRVFRRGTDGPQRSGAPAPDRPLYHHGAASAGSPEWRAAAIRVMLRPKWRPAVPAGNGAARGEPSLPPARRNSLRHCGTGASVHWASTQRAPVGGVGGRRLHVTTARRRVNRRGLCDAVAHRCPRRSNVPRPAAADGWLTWHGRLGSLRVSHCCGVRNPTRRSSQPYGRRQPRSVSLSRLRSPLLSVLDAVGISAPGTHRHRELAPHAALCGAGTCTSARVLAEELDPGLRAARDLRAAAVLISLTA